MKTESREYSVQSPVSYDFLLQVILIEVHISELLRRWIFREMRLENFIQRKCPGAVSTSIPAMKSYPSLVKHQTLAKHKQDE